MVVFVLSGFIIESWEVHASLDLQFQQTLYAAYSKKLKTGRTRVATFQVFCSKNLSSSFVKVEQPYLFLK